LLCVYDLLTGGVTTRYCPGPSVSLVCGAMTSPTILDNIADRFDPGHTALLIIDMQQDFCVEGFGAHRAGRSLAAARTAIPQIARLLHAARASGVRVAHVGFCTLPDNASDSGPWLAQRRRSTYSSDSLCVAGTPGADFVDELSPAPGEWVVRKHRYSAFTGTDLDLLLRSAAVRAIVITGVSTNACVESTLRAAFELDYYIAVPPDAVGSWDRTLHEATLANVNHRFGLTPSVEELMGVWQTRATCRRGAGE
jgi:nicotinamidase-related amidase